jgi:TetR/AcrR family transcriptional regulator, cholesterol catabolism regulator
MVSATMTLPALRDGVTQFKKGLILRAACKLFSERGYAATTIDAITAELSSSRRAIYDHFAGKAEMLVEICEQSVRVSLDLAERVSREPGDPVARIRRLARDFTAIVIENRDYIAVGTREMKFLPADSRRRILRMQEKFDRILQTILADGARQGLLASPDPALSALAIAGMIIWVHSWYRDDGRLSAEEIAESMADAALRMVRAGDR